jgi:hypothetical protein
MAANVFNWLVTYAALVLQTIFLVGAAGAVIVIALTAFDIFTEALKPDPQERREIDAIFRAA